jgi:hypothetical protein
MSHTRPCSSTTRSGRPCKAFAIHDSDPALCSVHAGRCHGAGGTKGNQNRLTHGFYSRHYTLQEIADLLDHQAAGGPGNILAAEIATSRIALRRVLGYLQDDDHLDSADFLAAVNLFFTGSATVARLLRTQQSLLDKPDDALSQLMNTVLDELNTQWNTDL